MKKSKRTGSVLFEAIGYLFFLSAMVALIVKLAKAVEEGGKLYDHVVEERRIMVMKD